MNHYALISVFNKSNISIIASAIAEKGFKIIATQGTGEVLKKSGISFLSITEATHNPNAFKDCIQSLSFSTAAGILFDRNNRIHQKQLTALSLKPIDIIVCNFHTLHKVVKDVDDFNIHHIDVGGPLMIRSAAVNFKDVLVVTDQNDYSMIAEALRNNSVDKKLRKQMAIKAFTYSSDYDSKIARLLESF